MEIIKEVKEWKATDLAQKNTNWKKKKKDKVLRHSSRNKRILTSKALSKVYGGIKQHYFTASIKYEISDKLNIIDKLLFNAHIYPVTMVCVDPVNGYIFTIDEEKADIVLKCTNLSINSLDGIFQALYSSFIPLWVNQCAIVSQYFLDEETSIIKEMIANEEYSDIIEDLERLTYIIYGFPGCDLYEVNTNDLDAIRERLQLNQFCYE